MRIGLVSDGRLRFPDELTTDSTWVVPDDVVHRTEGGLAGGRDRSGAVRSAWTAWARMCWPAR